MRLVRGLRHPIALPQGCVMTLGNFDGVHVGHRAIIERLAEQGRALGLPVVVMIFEPQPLEYFLGHNAPARLTRLREKVRQMACLPVDFLVVAKFDRHIADQEPERFVETTLAQQFRVRHLLVGDDFHFGKARRGNFALLRDMGQRLGFTVQNTASFYVEDQRVSSTLIRDALSDGQLTRARALLGRPYTVCGRVVQGAQLGRTLGFPTANVQLSRHNVPLRGVFAVRVIELAAQPVTGVANIGTRPTIQGGATVTLEVYLFDFDREIYGRVVEVEFVHKIRDEMRFASLDALQRQIADDAATARLFFNGE